MNDPPTALGVFEGKQERLLCRLDMNDPPTALGVFEGIKTGSDVGWI